jgi:alkylation response protein AidB-like acyl-CoA dehydrogenase
MVDASVVAARPSLEEFEAEVRGFLKSRCNGTEDARSEEEQSDADVQAEARRWQRERFDAGLGWIMGPREYGGRELSAEYERLFRRLELEYGAPPTSILQFGLTIIGSAILDHGTAETREKYLPGLYRGELAACQLFSEPGAGSDLAAVQTRAVRDGEEWVLNGQKVWTTQGHLSEVGECVCRTDPDAPKHRGITIFMVDMHAPGVEVRPLIDAVGGHHFNEVFLNDVRISEVDRIGPVNEGWRVLNTSLMNERAYVGESNEAGPARRQLSPEALAATLGEVGLLTDPVVRDGLAQLFVDFRAAALLTMHAQQRLDRGETPGPELSIAKLVFSDNQRRLVDFAADALGMRMTADAGQTDAFEWATGVLKGRSMRLAGGTDEIQRTIIGEKVLGLPKDPGIDNRVPFNQIPRSVGRR